MPQVPQRPLSYGEQLNKLRPTRTIICIKGTRDVATSEESKTPGNGVVKVSRLSHPLKCSQCEYVATSRASLNKHWLDEH